MKNKQQPEADKLTPKDFIDQDEVQEAMKALHENFLQKNRVVSDIVDDEGHQYVHLVQEGGGVLGVALVGYTYALEQMGIRFMRLAGTSAGAINTMMLTCIGDKASAKSEKILELLGNKKLFEFVDGHPFAQKIIKYFITNKPMIEHNMRRIKIVFLTLAILLAVDIISLGLQHKIWWFSIIARVSFVLTGLLALVCAFIVGYGMYMFKRFKERGLGINPGNNFHDWIKDILNRNGAGSIEAFKTKAETPPNGLRNRINPKDDGELKPDVTFITSDIISENKVEFPKMANLYTNDFSDACPIHPADFVRASMSIPIFFESYFIKDIDGAKDHIRQSWKEHFAVAETGIPAFSRFVDGGIMSNFPISIFYNPDRETPRMPTFGIRLDDTEPPPEKNENGNGLSTGKKQIVNNLSLGRYAGKLFNTVRFFYDKDFLRRNSVYEKGVGTIKVHEFNWLNFGLTHAEQKKLFTLGVLAAKEFLIGNNNQSGFNWEEYKAARTRLHYEEKKIQQQPKPQTI